MASLQFTVAAISLAQAIYASRAEAYGLTAERSWEHLEAREKHAYVTEAHLTLESVRPLPTARFDYFGQAVAITRRQALHLAGRD